MVRKQILETNQFIRIVDPTGLAYTLTVYPIMTSGDPDNDFMAHHVEDERGTNFKRRMVKASKYQKIVRRFLPVFDQRGLLDMKF